MTLVGAIATFVGVGLLAASSYAAVRLCALPGRAERLAACLLVVAGELVLIAELLSLVHGFRLGWALLALAVWCGAIVTVSARASSYRVVSAGEVSAAARSWAAGLWREIDTSRAAVLALALLTLIVVVEFVLAVAVTPNGFDALAYHLTRAAYWLQFHSIAQFAHATERQAAFPINAEVIQAWAMMLARGDRTVQLVQWLAGVGSLLVVFSFTRRLGFSRRDGVMTATVAASIPTVIGEASSAQNDLVFAFFAICVLLFGAIAVRDGSKPAGLLTGLAFGLAVGTKSVALPMIPAFAVFAVVLSGRDWRRLLVPVAAAVVAVVLVGGFNYAQNLEKHHSVTAAPSQDSLRVRSAGEVPENAVRIGWSAFASMPGLTVKPVRSAVNSVGDALFGWARVSGSSYLSFEPELGESMRDDHAGVGLIGVLLLLPALIIALMKPSIRERFALAVFAVTGFILIALTLRYNVWIARFLMPLFLALVPLTAVFFSRSWSRGAVVALIAITALPMLFFTDDRPVYGPSVFARSRPAQMAGSDVTYVKLFEDLDAKLPEHGRVGFVGAADSQEFELFGPGLHRTVVKLTPADVKPGVMERYDLDALVVFDDAAMPAARKLGAEAIGVSEPGKPPPTADLLLLRN